MQTPTRPADTHPAHSPSLASPPGLALVLCLAYVARVAIEGLVVFVF